MVGEPGLDGRERLGAVLTRQPPKSRAHQSRMNGTETFSSQRARVAVVSRLCG